MAIGSISGGGGAVPAFALAMDQGVATTDSVIYDSLAWAQDGSNNSYLSDNGTIGLKNGALSLGDGSGLYTFDAGGAIGASYLFLFAAGNQIILDPTQTGPALSISAPNFGVTGYGAGYFANGAISIGDNSGTSGYIDPYGNAKFGPSFGDVNIVEGNSGTGGHQISAGNWNIYGNGAISFDNGDITSDGIGGLALNGSVSFDGGAITSNGSGTLTLSALEAPSVGAPLYFYSPVDMDGGQIYTNGYGLLSVNSIVVGDTLQTDSGLISTDGTGNITAQEFRGSGEGLYSLRSNDTYAAGAIVPTGYVTFYDHTGTKYKIPALAA